MKNKLSIAIAFGLSTMCIATSGYSAGHEKMGKSFSIGGDVELDIIASEDENDSNFDHGGRIKLNAVGMVTNDNGYFGKGVAQPLVLFNPGDTNILIEQETTTYPGNDAIEVDDLYFQFGKTNTWDVQIGRFEAINLVPLGKDTLVANVGGVQVYEANIARGRKDDVLHTAFHVGNSDKFLFELGVMANKSGDDEFTAIRPAMTYNFGNIKLHAGLESISDNDSDFDGFGIGAGFKLGGGDLNVSYAHGEHENDDEVDTFAVNYTIGGFGAGYLHSEADGAGSDDPSVDTLYAAYTMPLLNLKDASVTFAVNTSKADNVGDNDTLNAAKLRFNYTF
ncbi:carbohydrate porin [uncultured Cocleimonas sp.]|uniref:carbohydrate porin n=1 Tax=uncultured Cocleimonas sp. TaxID=1051587 RepID=UPI0026135F03|nr:carbohydrate porin [uncultured Cocleimonas sp.]